jgi:16S rRNA (adenine1518-N6/adenine1519-N6)-dimethyltransferase
MAQSPQQIRSILSEAGTRPKHRFGQNFMVDQNLVRQVAEAGRVGPGDRVIEVGPGTGTLTEELLARGASVLAVEIDRDLAGALRSRFSKGSRVELIEGDALDGKHGLHRGLRDRLGHARANGEALKLVANLPYNIASPLVIELLLAGVGLLAFTVQKEVAERLRAKAGEEAYGPLSVMAQRLGAVEVLRTLPPGAFWPAPRIDSALVRIVATGPGSATAPSADTRALGQFVHAVFGYRRKTLRRALAEAGYDAARVLTATGLDGGVRPEVLTLDQFVSMHAAASDAPGARPRPGSPRGAGTPRWREGSSSRSRGSSTPSEAVGTARPRPLDRQPRDRS